MKWQKSTDNPNYIKELKDFQSEDATYGKTSVRCGFRLLVLDVVLDF